MRVRVKHWHHSSLTSRSALSLFRSVRRVLDFRDLITLTEVQRNYRVSRLRRITGWRFVQVEGGAMDECGVLFQKLKWTMLKVEAHQLSELPIPTTGRHVFALTVWLKHRRTGQVLIVSVAHLPAHVETLMHDGRHTPVVECYKDCIKGWHEYLDAKRSPQVSIMAVADWNLDIRKEWVRTWFISHFKNFKSAWIQGDRLPADGTLGDRLIDDTRFWNMAVYDIELARDDGSSDHRPFRETLLLP